MSKSGNSIFFYHLILSTNVPGWEDVLEILDEPAAEIWYHADCLVPHYHVVFHSNKLRNVSMVRKALGFFEGISVQVLDDTNAYRLALAYVRGKGERYVGQ